AGTAAADPGRDPVRRAGGCESAAVGAWSDEGARNTIGSPPSCGQNGGRLGRGDTTGGPATAGPRNRDEDPLPHRRGRGPSDLPSRGKGSTFLVRILGDPCRRLFGPCGV